MSEPREIAVGTLVPLRRTGARRLPGLLRSLRGLLSRFRSLLPSRLGQNLVGGVRSGGRSRVLVVGLDEALDGAHQIGHARAVDAKIALEGVGKVFELRNGKTGGMCGDPFSVLEGIDLTVEEGEFLAIVGPSGCGKSTLLDLVAGLTVPDAGRILVDGKTVVGPSLDRGIVFQAYALFPWRTVLGNVEFGLEAKGVPKKLRREKASEQLALVGLEGFEDRYPYQLSGGMKQRVAIARSLAYDPDILLMDEPFGALDAQTRETMQLELLRIWEKTRKTIMFVTHSIDEAALLGRRVAVLTDRPARVKTIVNVSLPTNVRLTAPDVRASADFVAVRHRLWQLLHEGERTHADRFGRPTSLWPGAPRVATGVA